MKKYYSIILMTGLIFTVAAGITLAGNTPAGNTLTGNTPADNKEVLSPSTPDSKIVYMHPKNIDPSMLPLKDEDDKEMSYRRL